VIGNLNSSTSVLWLVGSSTGKDALPIHLAKRLLEDSKGIRDLVREPQRAVELERDRAAPRRVGEELETRPASA
jgi:hypothetical protein